jgi:hypothetical protein
MIAVGFGLEEAQRQRLGTAGRKYGVLLLAGAAYLLFCRLTGWSLPCPFHYLTGLSCPGCGLTRLMLALAEGNLPAAFAANPALCLAAGPLAYLIFGDEWLWVRYGRAVTLTGQTWLLRGLFFWFLVYGIWRNL